MRGTTDIDAARMQLRVRHGKGAKERVLPLSPRLLEELRDYWRKQRAGKEGHKCPWLFLSTAPGEPMCRATGQNIYYRAVKKSGVRRKGGIHVLRSRSRGTTHLIESGWELPDIQRMLGHTSLLTTVRYLHITAQRRGKVRSPFDLIDTSKLPDPQGQPPQST
jgi:integrase/recombinase XerD